MRRLLRGGQSIAHLAPEVAGMAGALRGWDRQETKALSKHNAMPLPKRTPPLAEPGKAYLVTVDYDPGAHTQSLPGIAWRRGRLEKIVKRVQTHPGLPTANHRLHHQERAQIVATIRQLAWAAAFNARTPRFERCRLDAKLYFTRKQRRDAIDNYRGALKSVIDGLRDAGVLIDDDNRHVVAGDLEVLTDKERPRIELVLTEAPRRR